ncbi:MAG: hypothetical protein WAO61_10370 [Solirubrobacterales bacterium]
MSSRQTAVLAALSIAVAMLAAVAAASAATNKQTVKKGVKYLDRQRMSAFSYPGFKADAASALRAADKSGVNVKNSVIGEFVESLSSEAASYGVTAGATGKLMLAAVAGGKNPRCFGATADEKVDLYALQQRYYKPTGQYGDTSFDQALAMLGLSAGGHNVTKQAIKFVKNRRGKHGWSFSMSSGRGDDVESTALLIEALRAAGVKKSDNALRSAYAWMSKQRNIDYGYNPDTAAGETNANTTAYAIRAADALGKSNGKSKRALRRLQMKDGHFRLTPGADATAKVLSTSDAILALSGRHYPVSARRKPGASCVV